MASESYSAADMRPIELIERVLLRTLLLYTDTPTPETKASMANMPRTGRTAVCVLLVAFGASMTAF